MANDKEHHTCSVTGKRCRCGSDAGCVPSPYKSAVDPIAAKDIRALKWAVIHVDKACEVLDDNLHIDEYRRAYPGPELREIRRKLSTAKAMIEELL